MNKTRYFKCTKQLRREKFFKVGSIYKVDNDNFISDNNFNYAGGSCPNVESVIEFLSEFYEFEEIKKEEKKDMNKFKVGDMIKGTERGSKYSWTDKYMTKGEVTKVYSRGADDIEVQILEHSKGQKIGHKFDVNSNKFDLITPPKKSIHITFDNDTTHAIVKEDGKVVKREKVGLFKGDVYDEATGVREVIDKLYGKKVVEDKKNKEENKYPSFKVGDKVRILDGSKFDKYEGGWAFSMKKYIGKIATIKEIINDGKRIEFEEYDYCWDVRGIELIESSHSPISEYTTDELLSEIKKRMEK